MSFSEPRGRRVDAAGERHIVSVGKREKEGQTDRQLEVVSQLLGGSHQAELKRREGGLVEFSPPGLVPSVKICMLEIRDSSTSKWLSPSRNKYLVVGLKMKNKAGKLTGEHCQ